jgi:hypothetical protein
VGRGVGCFVGLGVGLGVGCGVGLDVGLGVDFGVGCGVGRGVGLGVGLGVGACVTVQSASQRHYHGGHFDDVRTLCILSSEMSRARSFVCSAHAQGAGR